MGSEGSQANRRRSKLPALATLSPWPTPETPYSAIGSRRSQKIRKYGKTASFACKCPACRTQCDCGSNLRRPALGSNLVVVEVRIEELVDLVLFDRTLHCRLVDVCDLNTHWARASCRGSAHSRKHARRKRGGTHTR